MNPRKSRPRNRKPPQAQRATNRCGPALLLRTQPFSGDYPVIEASLIESHRLGYSRVETAAILSVSVRTIDNLIADKTSGFPIRRIGRKVVIPRRELELWLEQQTEAHTQRHAPTTSGGD